MCLSQYLWIDHIRKLEIEHISFNTDMHRPAFSSRSPRTSLVEELRFVDCSPQALGVLPNLLLMIKRLKAFVLETNCPASVRENRWAKPHTMRPYQFALALEPHAGSLEEIAIAFSNGAGLMLESTPELTA